MQHQQQQQQQRSSFYRANRPGNLNIIDINDSPVALNSSLLNHQQQQTSAGYSTNNQSTFSNNQQANSYNSNNTNNLNSPYVQTQLQQQNPISPSYHRNSYQTPTQPPQYNNNNNTAQQQQQSYTPKYSPCPSSAHILSKQNYFNFDVPSAPAVQANSAIPQSPNPQQAQYTVPNSPHLSNQTKKLSISTNYTNRTNQILNYNNQQQQQQQSYQSFSNQQQQQTSSYQKIPLTPASALPFQSYQTQLQQSSAHHHSHHANHSLSVPNSPYLHHHHPQQQQQTYHQQQQQQHSVFQFNPNQNQQQQPPQTPTYQSSFYQPSTPTVNPVPAPPQDSSSTRSVLNNESFEFNTVDDVPLTSVTNSNPNDLDSNLDPSNNQQNSSGVDDTGLVTTNTYGENDVDMVQEVINDMIQKEEINNIKLSPNYLTMNPESVSSASSTSTSSASSVSTMPRSNATPPSIDNHTNNNMLNHAQQQQAHFDLSSFDSTANSQTSRKLNSMLDNEPSIDMNNNNTTEINANNLSNFKKSNLDSLTSVANILLNQPTAINQKASIFSLSNLSEAASAEFLLNYANNGSKTKLDDENTNKLLQSIDQADLELSNESSKSKNIKKTQVKMSSNKNSNLDNMLFGTTNSPQQKAMLDDAYSTMNLNPSSVLSCSSVGSSSSSSTIQSCADCGKIFTNKSALAKHRLIHSNERKYACHLCDKSFKRQDHLNGHLLTHQDKKPFVCKAPGCDKSYCDSRSLKRHVESQHQDYLALLANGNQEALNYLPSIGKIKANLAPNLHHEISVQDIIKTNKHEIAKSNHHHHNNHHHHHQQQYSPITPVPGQIDDSKMISNIPADIVPNQPRPKNFFTFEEPKPETCKICGKGFKNIPALNGHMRLHGGFIKTKLSITKNSNLTTTNDLSNQDQQPNSNSSQQNLHQSQPHSNQASLSFNDDSMSSNCSSNNSFSSNLSSNTNNQFNLLSQLNNNNSQSSISSKQSSFQHQAASLFSNNDSNQSFTKTKPKHPRISEKNLPGKKINENSQTNESIPKNDQAQLEPSYFPSFQQSAQSKSINLSYPSLATNQFNQINQYLDQGKKSLPKSNKEETECVDVNQTKYISNILQPIHSVTKPPSSSEYSNSFFHNQKQFNQTNRFLETQSSQAQSYSLDHSVSHMTESSKIDYSKSIPFSSGPPSNQSNYESQTEKQQSSYLNQQSDETLENNQENSLQILSKQIYNITSALLSKHSSIQAAAATAAAVAAVASINSNQQQQQNDCNLNKTQLAGSNKPKTKPVPLVIPSDISAFQQQKQKDQSYGFNSQTGFGVNGFQKSNIPFYHQLSTGSYMSHVYPHATLLKSPRLFDYDAKKQYTPPPMLSPFRKGPGLFYNSKHLANLFLLPPTLPQAKHPIYNHSMSCSSYAYPSTFYFNHGMENSFNENMNLSTHAGEIRQVEQANNFGHLEFEFNNQRKSNATKIESDEPKEEIVQRVEEKTTSEAVVVVEKSDPKPTVVRARLLSQMSSQNTGGTGTFFPEESATANETIAAALMDCTEPLNTKPFINIGDDFQASLPELKKFKDSDKELMNECREDKMWSNEKLSKVNSAQFASYLDLICKSSLIYGSSNNLELGLHILHYFDGDVKRSIKAFLDDSIDLPVNHPISTYKYNETDIWKQNEIKKFELAILKHDKIFSEIANEVGTKTIKQCIEFYYLWKKVMSDSMKKKWKNFKKNRSFEDSIEQNLRSSSSTNTNKNSITNTNETENENDTELEINLSQNELNLNNTNNENEFDEQQDNIDAMSCLSNTNSSISKSYLKETQKTKSFDDNNKSSRMSTPSPLQSSTNGYQRYECDKCNQMFKTKKI